MASAPADRLFAHPDVEPRTRILVIGLGGAGCNSVANMSTFWTEGPPVIAINTDAQCLAGCEAPRVLQIGRDTTKGLGANGDAHLGRMAIEESREAIKELLQDIDMLFLAVGLGGGTGSGGADWGFLAIGGQRNTVMVSVSGTGLAAARDGWENRLHAFLSQAKRARLTRVDVAHDCYSGEYTVDKARDDYRAGGADCSGRMPVCEERGDWYRPNGSGRTFYIGKRTNGKYARVYEKGKQLGDPSSEWTRVEVEFKSVDRVLPLDLLLLPGKYLAGAYPMFEWINAKAERIQTIKKALAAGYERCVTYARRQVGGALAFIAEMEGGVQQAFDLLRRDVGKVPAWVQKVVPTLDDAPQGLHDQARPGLPEGLVVERWVAAW